MLKGFSQPRTPKGLSSLVPPPPWHFVGNVLAVEYESDPDAVASFLPEKLGPLSGKCCVYFIEWQYASDDGEEHLDPVRSQYRETLFLISGAYQGKPIAFCPFIWVDQDLSLVRGMIQGWPKQLGSTWMTRAYSLPSKAGAMEAAGGQFGATLSVREQRIAEARVMLCEQTHTLPSPGFSSAVNLRWFPDMALGKQDAPLVNDLVQLKSKDIAVSPIWKGEASLKIAEDPLLEISGLKPLSVTAGYRFTLALTVHDLIRLV